jgi:hypothetical protein
LLSDTYLHETCRFGEEFRCIWGRRRGSAKIRLLFLRVGAKSRRGIDHDVPELP